MENQIEMFREIISVYKKYGLTFKEAIESLEQLKETIEHIALNNKI